MWNKTLRHHDMSSSVHVISVEEDQIKLGLRHFCKQTASAKSPKKLEVLVFQNPSSLENKTDAYITVYAVPKCSEKVKVMKHHFGDKFCKEKDNTHSHSQIIVGEENVARLHFLKHNIYNKITL